MPSRAWRYYEEAPAEVFEETSEEASESAFEEAFKETSEEASVSNARLNCVS